MEYTAKEVFLASMLNAIGDKSEACPMLKFGVKCEDRKFTTLADIYGEMACIGNCMNAWLRVADKMCNEN